MIYSKSFATTVSKMKAMIKMLKPDMSWISKAITPTDKDPFEAGQDQGTLTISFNQTSGRA